MATLVSPGVSISVIDQSINVGAGPGTVPLIFIVTQQDKVDPTGQSIIAPGTTQANAGKVWSITSQRELVATFGDPVFYSVSGTSINGYPLNEYGLLAAYSYLGLSNLVRVVRADVDTKQLEATPIQPTSPASPGTYWLDESALPNGSSYGLFVQNGTSPSATATWVPVTVKYVYNFAAGTVNPPVPPVGGFPVGAAVAGGTVTPRPTSTDGVNGDYAVVFQTSPGLLTYWVKTSGVWVQLGSTMGTLTKIQSMWPDLSTTLVREQYWIKTSSPAQGANLVLRRMNTSGVFVQVETPILDNDFAANIYYSTDATGSAGKIYVKPVINGPVGSEAKNSFEFRYSSTAVGNWSPLRVIIGSETEPTEGPVNGQQWFNTLLGVDNNGQSTVDILIADGDGHWQNINLPGFPSLPVKSGKPTLYTQAEDPRDNVPAPTLSTGDLWVETDNSPYPIIKKWSGSAWVLINNADQTTSNGIIFQDCRPNPMFVAGAGYSGVNNGGGAGNPDLDPDAPDSDLYPKGFLLWNTRYSSNNVKEWQSPYIYNDVPADPDNTNNDSTGRWVNRSGNKPNGVPYMGSAAQQIVLVQGIQSQIVYNEEIRAEDLYFNLIAAPGFVEAIDEMLVLNDDRKDTAFVVGDTPFTLSATGTALQNWATNASTAFTNGVDGLTSVSKYFGVWYPSGLSTNVDGTDVVVPPSHMALRTIAYNDQVAYPWFAPAGLQRGVVNNAGSVGYVNEAGQYIPVKLSEGQRNILYNNGINPIRTMPTGGNVIWGQKTRQPYSSATDRINVVRLENYLRYQFNQLAQPFLFEPNDATTRKAVTDAFNRFLSELVTLRALYDFLVVCDLSNNTPARIDRSELWIDVAIQPVKAIEFIYIPVRIVNTGASLTA